jgi:hypothetical protein
VTAPRQTVCETLRGVIKAVPRHSGGAPSWTDIGAVRTGRARRLRRGLSSESGSVTREGGQRTRIKSVRGVGVPPTGPISTPPQCRISA